MTDLIDRAALREELARCPFYSQDSTAALMQADTVMALLDSAPAVACERCRHWQEWKPGAFDCDEEWCGYGCNPKTFGCAHFKEAEHD